MDPKPSRLIAFAAVAALCAATLAGCSRRPVSGESTSPVPEGRSTSMFTVTSSAFGDGGRIPMEYASARAGGENRSLPLSWTGAPPETRSFALAVVDHAPVAHMWVHWAVVGIPPDVTSLPVGASGTSRMPEGSRELTNTGGVAGYSGPAPPPRSGDHPYVVTVYALSSPSLDLPPAPTAADIEKAVAGKVIDTAEITGIYSR